MFLDETWATTALSPVRGWALKGERLVCTVPHGHWHTTTFLCGLRTTGLVAPLVLDGAMNGPAFELCGKLGDGAIRRRSVLTC